MNKLEDGIHQCNGCEIYPCSLQEEVSKEICKDCPTPCCRAVLVALVPCEEKKLKNGLSGALKMNRDDGWCYYFDKNNERCIIYQQRPIGRVASCRFIIEGKVPEEIKALKKRIRNILSEDKISPLLKYDNL